jgi:Icc-related predicted phosphoesterase
LGSLETVRIHVVSDVHGNADALARAGDSADALIVLGDLLDFVDYHDYSGGIFGEIFGPDAVAKFAELRRSTVPTEAGAYVRSLWASVEDPRRRVQEAIRDQYAKLFAAMTAPTYVTPGNVDAPALWSEFAGEGITVLDGEVTEIAGLRFGFVGGTVLAEGAKLRPGMGWTPYLRSQADFAEGVSRLRDIDVLCSHVPPAIPELTYDVVARRAELGSSALLDCIDRQRPRWSLFGHVHQPLAQRVRHGGTECVNVGHFQRTATPYVLHV